MFLARAPLPLFLLFLGLAPRAEGASPQVSAGFQGSAALHADGSVIAWGQSPQGTPLVPGLRNAPPDVVAIANGGGFVLALRADGTVLAAGSNFSGQLGDGTTTSRAEFAPVPGLGRAKAISASGASAYALLEDGSVRAWGDNRGGKLGDGTTDNRSSPVLVRNLSNIVALATGGNFSASALRADGLVFTWGDNTVGALGDGTNTSRLEPGVVPGISGVVSICKGSAHSLALKADGSVWGWGYNFHGQLAIDGQAFSPVPIPALAGSAAVECGGDRSFAIRADGNVWAFGSNTAGALGIGNDALTQTATPTRVEGLPPIVALSVGNAHAIALARDGSVHAWGDNSSGQLGDNTMQSRGRPGPVAGLGGGAGPLNLVTARPSPANLPPIALFGVNPTSGAAPLSVTLGAHPASDPDGRIVSYDWSASSGETASGIDATMVLSRPGIQTIQLLVTDDAGARSVASLPVTVTGGSLQAKPAIAPVGAGTLALADDGRVWGWGVAYQIGALAGNVAANSQVTPRFLNLTGAASIAAGYFGPFFAIDGAGNVDAWGGNANGQLGIGRTSAYEARPVRLAITDVASASASYSYTLFLKRDGTVWSAGQNDVGQLGDGTRTDRAAPVPVSGLPRIAAVSAGARHALAIDVDGNVWGWGENAYGNLGDGTLVHPRTSPVRTGLTNVAKVAAGESHSLALLRDGSVLGWGPNFNGTVGDGTHEVRNAPVRIAIDLATDIAVSAFHSLAITRTGALYAWGLNCVKGGGDGSICTPAGQLGNGSLEPQPSPVRITAPDRLVGIAAGYTSSFALRDDGTVWAWGRNDQGQLGDGTLANRLTPQIVLGPEGAGVFDLAPGVANDPASVPGAPFKAIARDTGSDTVRTVDADIQVRAQDAGLTGNVYVFALAPATRVLGAKSLEAKDTPAACVLAQLNASGQLTAVDAGTLRSAISGVLAAQGQTVSVLNNVPAPNVAGATLFVGYGSSPSAMLAGGTNRGVVSVPDSVACVPQPPQKGWWWNPIEDGRGFSIERQGNNLFFAAFLYDVTGRSTWYVSSGPTSLDGAYYTGDLLSASGGQSLGGAYPGFPALRTEGAVTLAFNSSSTGTMAWPGGVVPIQRFDIIPAGLAKGPASAMPEGGWWWNPQESGRGFFLEWQGSTLDIAAYLYDDAGHPVWYLTVGEQSTDGKNFAANWWSYGNGQTLMGAWKPNARLSTTVAPVTITFSGPDTAIMTLPNGRSTALTRHRF